MVSTGAEAAIRSPHDVQEAEVLLLGAHGPGRVRSAVSMCPLKQRRNWADRSMGSGDRSV
jgi:hypothetical protein